MTLSLTYPGVYLTEQSDMPMSVTPATTSLAAFIGAYAKGPIDEAVLVSSLSEFNQVFGGVLAASLASYAVWQFFANGGGSAWIVRVVPPDAQVAEGKLGEVNLQASSPGAWASGLSAKLSTVGTSFTLEVADSNERVVETLTGLPSTSEIALAQAISTRSAYLRASSSSAARPQNATATLESGKDGTWSAENYANVVNTQLGFPPQPPAGQAAGSTLPLLDQIAPQVFNVLCLPDAPLLAASSALSLYSNALSFCKNRRAFAIVDPAPPAAAVAGGVPVLFSDSPSTIDSVGGQPDALQLLCDWAVLGPNNYSGAAYYPWVTIVDPLTQQQRVVPPSGTVAGVYATTDQTRGVWKAPAGVAATLVGVTALADTTITDTVNGTLNVIGVNCLRTFPIYQNVIWGARTLGGADLDPVAFRYVSVRRLTDFIEQSLQQSLRWAVFEPNAPSLWASISLEVGTFMSDLYAAGALGGATAAQAYQVVCDATTTSEQDILNGTVNVLVRFQPVEPAEFVVVNVQLTAGSPS